MQIESIEKSAFSPGSGYSLCKFTVMPYGLIGVTQTCQHSLDTALYHCKRCVDNHVDNCLVFPVTWLYMPGTFRRYWEHCKMQDGLKCAFSKTNIIHLRRFSVWHKWGISFCWQDSNNIKSCVKINQSFNSFNFYRHFIDNYADIAAPLTDLTSSKVTFI